MAGQPLSLSPVELRLAMYFRSYSTTRGKVLNTNLVLSFSCLKPFSALSCSNTKIKHVSNWPLQTFPDLLLPSHAPKKTTYLQLHWTPHLFVLCFYDSAPFLLVFSVRIIIFFKPKSTFHLQPRDIFLYVKLTM